MTEVPAIERRGDDYALRLYGGDTEYRIIVPGDMLDDEIGKDADETACREWIEANLAHILGAATARETGGIVTEPWGRLLIEEFP